MSAPAHAGPLFKGTGAHWRRQYSRRSFLKLGGAVAAAGVVIYSGLDEAVTAAHDKHVRSPASDRVSRVGYETGNRPWFLAWLGVAAIDAWVRSVPFTHTRTVLGAASPALLRRLALAVAARLQTAPPVVYDATINRNFLAAVAAAYREQGEKEGIERLRD